MAGNDTTVKFRADISQLKSQMQAAERQIKLVNSEFKAATAGMDDWTKSADGLTAKTKQLTSVLDGQNKKLELMEKELDATVKAYGENSAAADRVRIKINEQKAAIAKTESQLKTYEDKLSDLSKGMDEAADGSKEFISATDKLKDSIKDQESKLESLKKHYSDLTLEGKGLSDEAEDTARQIKELSGELAENKAKLDDAEKAAGEFDESLEEVDEAADKAADGFTVFKGALADLVADGIRATISAIKDLAKEAFEVGSNFEAEMSKVGAVSGASAEEMEQLTAKAEEMGAKTKFSATESAQAFEYMAMAGWKTEDMLGGIEGIMNLAAASGADLATASDIVTDALTAMGYGAQDAGRLADVMAAASSNANTNVEMMGATFQYAAPIVGALGYNMEDTAVAIGLMANSGIKADKAGTALRSILTRLAAPPKECAKAMEDLGLSLTDADGNMKDFSQVTRELRRAFDGMSEAEQASYAKHLAGQQAMSGLLAIVNATTEDYEKLTDAVYNSAGAAEDMANTMNDNVSGAITLLKSKIEGIMIKLFNRAKDSMRDGIDTFSNALDKIDWDKVGDAIGEIAKKAAELFEYAVNNSDRIISIIKAIGTAIGVVFVTNKITSFTSAIGGVLTVLTSAKSGTEALSAATKMLGINMSALPVAVLVSSMAALYTYMTSLEKQYEADARAAYGLTEEQKELIDTIDESAAALERASEARKDKGKEIDAEYSDLGDLVRQYNNLIDENGKVKEGYEELADELLGELAQGLNTTIDNIKENIDQNGKLGESIDQLIKKKKDEAKISAFESDYKDALKNELKYFQELKTAKDNSKAAQDRLNDAQANYNKAVGELQKYAKNGSMVPWDVSQQAGKAQKDLEAAKATYEELNGAVDQAATNWGKAQSLIESYQDAMTASTEGNADKMNDALLSMQYGLVNHTNASKKELDKQYLNTKKELEDIKELYKEGKVSADIVEDYEQVNKLAGAELDKWVLKNRSAAEDTANGFSEGLGKALPKVTVTSGELGTASNLALFEGMGDWRTIADEKASEFVGAIEDKDKDARDKGAQLSMSAAEGANSKKGDFEDAADVSANGFISKLGSFNNEYKTTGETAAKTAAAGMKSQLGEFTDAAESEANEYKNKIDSHSSDYKSSGEQAAVNAADGARNKINEFKDAGDKSADEYTSTIDSKTDRYRSSGQQMAESTADGASEKADAMQNPAEKAVSEFADYIENNKERGYTAGSSLASEAVSGADSKSEDAKDSGENFAQGFINGIGKLVEAAYNKAKELAKSAWAGLKKGQDEGSPSKLTTQSGVYFTQGYINGIKSLTKTAVKAAADVGLGAVKALQSAQQEGSPSKLTYKSGKNFTQGFINGITSLETKLIKTSQNMVKSVIKQLKSLNGFNFDEVAGNASNSYSDALTRKMEYTSGWMQYKNEQMLADFDKTISGIKSQSDKEVAALQNAAAKGDEQIRKNSEKLQAQLLKQSEAVKKEISKNSAAEQKALQKEIDAIKDISAGDRSDEQREQLKKYEKQLKAAKEKEKKLLAAEENAYKKLIAADNKQVENSIKNGQAAVAKEVKQIQKTYNKQINAQQKMKDAYQRASSTLISDFNKAMDNYQQAAQALIDSTMEDITTRYSAEYDNLIRKQDDLIEKLKNAGDAFSLDDANLLTTEDLNAQTQQMIRYANKLKKLKGKVSDELFAQVQSYDVKEGEAFANRLLKMSKKDLEAYNDAYLAKLNTAESLAGQIYKKDFENLKKDYKTEVNDAFEGLDKDLEEIGKQCLEGFVKGLTSDTSYMNSSIKTFVNGMIDTFKKELGIKSPSKVTKKLGSYTAEGFAVGITENSKKVDKAVDKAIKTAEKSFDFSRLSLVDGFDDAMADFESKAKSILTATVEDIGTTYQAKAAEIFTKQDSLAKKLKDSGSLFDMSNLNIMSTDDLKAQTKQIKDYANKLTKIKNKVSNELFEAISSYDMQDGEEFIDRLLSMSKKELTAYNQAYTEKLKTADKVAQKVYAKELDKVAKGYNTEISYAFKDLDDSLLEIGTQCFSGFIKGLTGDSKYLTTSVETMIDGMVKTFKTKLGIKSPSKVTKQLGAYTAEGFAAGIESNTSKITTAIDDAVKKTEKSYNWTRLSLIDGFNDAMSDFESQAKSILTSTIEDIGTTYQTKADDIFSKQESLAQKLKDSGSLFDMSSLNMMTTEDLQAQTKQIKDYYNKLSKIQGKVSSDLFEQISSYDMKDGEKYIDRLLSMSDKELKAYNKAYTEKMETADKLSQKFYQKELDTVAKDYNNAISNAFKDLGGQMTTIGQQCLAGFTKGLTGDTKYLKESVDQITSTLIKTFEKKLGIASPSKVTMKLGAYTTEGFAEGIAKNESMVTNAIDKIMKDVQSGFDFSRLSLIDGFSEAMSEFESQARDVLTEKVQKIGETYQAKADEIFSKQEDLAEKFKDSGSLFDLSNLNMMTTEDLQAQTKQITDYYNKLTKIQGKVSAELFEQIASYDMKDGEKYIDRLLSMSDKELSVYNKAYKDKLQTADKLSKQFYAKELDKAAQDYNKEITTAFNGLDDELLKIGKQCLSGFVNGLTSDTKYIKTSVNTLINTMVSTFKKGLGIASPSKVTKKLGAYTAEGFADGISANADMVNDAVDEIMEGVQSGFNWSRLSLIDGFSEAMSDFESQAKEILTDKIRSIGETYKAKADEIFSKQDSLAKSLKDLSGLFGSNNANLMTTKDLEREAQKFNTYADKLAKIKDKVSESLFEQITSYDMKDGEAFIDRLLSMSAKELEAYNKAYTSKLETADKVAQKVYAKELDKVAQDYNKEIATAFNGLDDELLKIGKQCLAGFVGGLTSDTKYIENSVNTLVNEVVTTFKKKLGIASPSKVTKKLGAYTAEGFAEGISDNTSMITKAIDKMTKSLESSFDFSRLSLIDGFTSAVSEFTNEAKTVLTNSISKIGETYQKKFDEILSSRTNLTEKFKEMGDLFSLNNANVMKINDISAQIKDIETYAKRLETIKGKVSSSLFEEIASYNAKEGSAFIEQLLSMSDKELKAYSDAYDKKLSLSEKLSENLYQSEFNKVANEYDSAIEKAFKDLPKTLQEIGTQTMQGFLKGLGGDAAYFTQDVKNIVNQLVTAFKTELGIHSPSKVMEELGEYTGEGFMNGLMSMVKAVKDAAEEMSSAVSSALNWQGDIYDARGTLKQAAAESAQNRSAGTFEGANTQIINFNQTNNSPKALDRLTLYRQTNNMLFSAKVRLADV